jgi:hypothetical protein
MARSRFHDRIPRPISNSPSPDERRPCRFPVSNGNGRKKTVTIAGGKWNGVETRTGVKLDPPSSPVWVSVLSSSVSTVSCVRLSTPRNDAVRPASTTPRTKRNSNPNIRSMGAR